MTRRMTLERAVDLAIAAENRRALADPQLDEWIEHRSACGATWRTAARSP